ncbi:hypothetical protein SEMRO_748_G196610.1 [Seminavis robusta]|uniref:Uncharacterized protein n=1 Tax=Seminavis robusta TaxID=568900 RepID=A0A9N8E8S8_9STRA|nr:hypothetical protein SEMRO_748_G196610.1 [Seminavis robusta]|eukprot:Sro748_g196610.1 n/a (655) ;mRNA; f:3901-5865
MASSDDDNDKKPPARKAYVNPYAKKEKSKDASSKPKPLARMQTSGKAPRSQYPSGYSQYESVDDVDVGDDIQNEPAQSSRKPPPYASSSDRLRFDPFHPHSPSNDGYVPPQKDSPNTAIAKKRRSTINSIRPGSKLLDSGSVYYHVPAIYAAENPNSPPGTPPRQPVAGMVDDNPAPPAGVPSPGIMPAHPSPAKNSNDDEEDEFPLEDFVRLGATTLTLSERCYVTIDNLKVSKVFLIDVVQRYYHGCNQSYLDSGLEIAWKFEDHLLKQPIFWIAQSGYPFPRPRDNFAMMGLYFHPDKFIEMLQMLHYAISMEWGFFNKVADAFKWNHDEYAQRLTFFKEAHPFSGWMCRRRERAEVDNIHDPIQDPDNDNDSDDDDNDNNHGPDRDGGGIRGKQRNGSRGTSANNNTNNKSQPEIRGDGNGGLLPNQAYIPLTIRTGKYSMEFGMGGTEESLNLSSTPKCSVHASRKRAPDTDDSGRTAETALVITDSGDVEEPPKAVAKPVVPKQGAASKPKPGSTSKTALEIHSSSSEDSDRKPAAKKKTSASGSSTDETTDNSSDDSTEDNTDGSPESLSSLSSRDSPPTRAAKQKNSKKTVRRRLQLTKEEESSESESEAEESKELQHCSQDSEEEDDNKDASSPGGNSSTTSLTY